ncbi:MAG: MarR family transcriptional regulator [Arenicellales bacterium]|jgi:DNA-binding MarR family transcriptional regulator|nr:MarR family transcriptional regulator [Arenicellales bacterium]|tara:strand:+ start:141 stop:656 length:516 start_codon:yes stop_codon:yes gene_type:complete
MKAQSQTSDVAATISRSKASRKSALRAWLRLWACVGSVERVVRTRLYSDHGMTLPRFDYLSQLYREPDRRMNMTELSRRLMVSGGNVTGLTDRLVADGLVKREQDPSDRRVQIIVLTDDGYERFIQVALEHEKWIGELFEDLGPDQMGVLNQTLGQLKQSLERKLNEQQEE